MLGFLYHGTKIEVNSWNSAPKHVSDKNTLSILFAGAGFFVKLIFSPFSSVPSLEIDSSVKNFDMPRNELFLPRNNGSHSESVPWKIFRNEIPLPTVPMVHFR